MWSSWPWPIVLKKCEAIGPRGQGAASGDGSGSMWRTEIARLPSDSFKTSSGLDSSPWALVGWAKKKTFYMI